MKSAVLNRMAVVLLLAAATGLGLQACASFPRQEEMRSMARVYDRPYETVYGSVQELLLKDLRCALKEDDRDGGRLETEWVHRIDTEGRKRWMIRADVHRVGSGTEVVFYKKSDLQDEVSKSINKYKAKKDTPPSAASGWKKTDIDLAGVTGLYRMLEKRLAAHDAHE